jgi:hypothetical protein
MRPRDWFSVGVRLFGVWVFYRGFAYLLAFGAARFDLRYSSSLAAELDVSRGTELYFLWYAVGYSTLAAFFVFGAERLTKVVFNEAIDETDDESANLPI